jgi:hypothetical protein
MALPVFVEAGTGQLWQSGGAVAMTITADVGNVIIIHVLEDGTGAGPSFSSITNLAALDGTASSFTGIATENVGTGPEARNTVQIARATGTAVSISMTQTSGNDLYGRLYEFSGVNTGATLADVIENASAGAFVNGVGLSTTIADTGVTTLGADRLAINLIAVNDDNQASFDTEAFTGQTGGTWVSGGSYGSATGTDGAIGLQIADMSSAGTINGGTLTMASDPWGVIGFALLPLRVPRSPGVDSGNAHF